MCYSAVCVTRNLHLNSLPVSSFRKKNKPLSLCVGTVGNALTRPSDSAGSSKYAHLLTYENVSKLRIANLFFPFFIATAIRGLTLDLINLWCMCLSANFHSLLIFNLPFQSLPFWNSILQLMQIYISRNLHINMSSILSRDYWLYSLKEVTDITQYHKLP